MLYHTGIVSAIYIPRGDRGFSMDGESPTRFDDDSDEPDWRKAIIVLSRKYPISTLDEKPDSDS
ncbi:hypothetical protein COOONC_08139 [Cooperia oncophora]